MSRLRCTCDTVAESLVSAKGLTLAPYTAEPMFVDDVRFSNAATVEHNVLGPGEVGHILRSRTTTVSGGAYAPADAWFAFNQVGSVVNHTNSAGAMTQAVEMDAWGNTLASAASGAWGAQQEGFGFQSKRYSALSGSHYFWLRYNDSTIGGFLSRAPYPPFAEHPYSAFAANPVFWVDPYGAAEDYPDWWNISDLIKYGLIKPITDNWFNPMHCVAARNNQIYIILGSSRRQDADETIGLVADLGTEVVLAAGGLLPADKALDAKFGKNNELRGKAGKVLHRIKEEFFGRGGRHGRRCCSIDLDSLEVFSDDTGELMGSIRDGLKLR